MSDPMRSWLASLGVDFLAPRQSDDADAVRYARLSMSQLGRWLTVDCNTAWLAPGSPCCNRLFPPFDDWNDV